MFKIVHKDLAHQGKIRFSRAEGEAKLAATTGGVALKYVLKGNEFYQIGEQSVKVGPGQFIIIPDGVSFKAVTKDELTTGICVDLCSAQVAMLFPEIEKLDILFGITFSHVHHNSLSSSIYNLNGLLQSTQNSTLLDEVYSEFVELCKMVNSMQKGLNKAYRKTWSKQEVLLRLLMAKDHIDRHYKDKLKLNTLASFVGLSGSHLQRLFTLCFQTTPKKLQKELRMRSAASLILEDKYSLEEIAFELGYTDLPAFSNQFRTYFNTTPSSFKNSIA